MRNKNRDPLFYLRKAAAETRLLVTQSMLEDGLQAGLDVLEALVIAKRLDVGDLDRAIDAHGALLASIIAESTEYGTPIALHGPVVYALYTFISEHPGLAWKAGEGWELRENGKVVRRWRTSPQKPARRKPAPKAVPAPETVPTPASTTEPQLERLPLPARVQNGKGHHAAVGNIHE